jgi:hypothetical protein
MEVRGITRKVTLLAFKAVQSIFSVKTYIIKREIIDA